METLYPVVVSVPEALRKLPPRQQVPELSRLARKAVGISARKAGLPLEDLKKDKKGAPVPFRGIYWSLSHKPTFVAGVVSPEPVGIDIESSRTIHKGIYRKVGRDAEWELLGGRTSENFLRLWTAKEAVLKAGGIGFADISRCILEGCPDPLHLNLQYRDREWRVEHFYFRDHIASTIQNKWVLSWSLVEPGTGGVADIDAGAHT